MIPICASSINYYMIGYYPTFDAYLYLVMVGIVISAIGVSFGYFISVNLLAHFPLFVLNFIILFFSVSATTPISPLPSVHR